MKNLSHDQRHQELREELRSTFTRARLPTSPGLAAQILDLIHDPQSGASDLGEAIRTDPALTARLLQTVNSVHFAQRSPVTTIDRAVTILGLTRIKTISLGFQLVSHLDRLGGTPFDMPRFWEHSLLRACYGRSVAQEVTPQYAEEAFLAGLLQECGILLLVQILGAPYAKLYAGHLSPAAFYRVEHESFPYTHVDAISVMAEEWKLPNMIGIPLMRHHRRLELGVHASEVERLSAVAYFVGGLRFTADSLVVAEEVEHASYMTDVLGLDESGWQRATRRAGEEFQRLATLYGEVLPANVDVNDLLNEAVAQLWLAVAQAGERIIDVERERDAILQDRERLASSLAEYRDRATIDPLTEVLNRATLMESLNQTIRECAATGETLGVVFIDIDHFKGLNDEFGHEAGDRVLRALCSVAAAQAEGIGRLGRYGGDEFVVWLRSVSEAQCQRIANGIVEGVRGIDAETLGCSARRVTVSVGATWCRSAVSITAEALLAAADREMYRAKHQGRDTARYAAFVASPGHAGAGGRPERLAGPREDDANTELAHVARSLNRDASSTAGGLRKQPRRGYVASCRIHFFSGVDMVQRAESAVTRNICSGGVGLIAAHTLTRGEPIEVVLNRAGSDLYLAGLVSFCRRVDDDAFEVGVQFVDYAVEPILSAPAADAGQQPEWVQRAIAFTQRKAEAPTTD